MIFIVMISNIAPQVATAGETFVYVETMHAQCVTLVYIYIYLMYILGGVHPCTRPFGADPPLFEGILSTSVCK